jgi:hypothetical protein
VLSKDTEFTTTGPATGFNYVKAYDTYKELASKLWLHVRGRETIARWNSIVFHGVGLNDEDSPVEEYDDVAALMRQMEEQIQSEGTVFPEDGPLFPE